MYKAFRIDPVSEHRHIQIHHVMRAPSRLQAGGQHARLPIVDGKPEHREQFKQYATRYITWHGSQEASSFADTGRAGSSLKRSIIIDCPRSNVLQDQALEGREARLVIDQ